MRPYFEKMKEFGSALKPGMIKSRENNVKLIKDVEAEISKAVDKVRNVGLPAAEINKRKQLTIWQRLAYLLDPGTSTPLNTLYNPNSNVEGTNNVCHGLAKVSGKWAVVIGFDNKVIAGAWPLLGKRSLVFTSSGSTEREFVHSGKLDAIRVMWGRGRSSSAA